MIKLKDICVVCGQLDGTEPGVISCIYEDNKSKIKIVGLDEVFFLDEQEANILKKYFCMDNVEIYTSDYLLYLYLDHKIGKLGKKENLYTKNKEISEHKLKRYLENTIIDDNNIDKFNNIFREAYKITLKEKDKKQERKGIYYEEKTF